MTDAPLASVPPVSPSSTPEFRTGQRVEVNNLDEHGMPNPFHACRGIIKMLFREEGQVVAKVEFNNGVQRKFFVTKLMPVPTKPQPQPVRPPAAPPTPAPALSIWAKPGCIMVRGDQLQPRDLVFLTKHTNPRRLIRWLDDRTWIGSIIWYGYDNSVAPEQPVTINPGRWYVVKRK